ncbi:MAG: complex I subunit 5 family protein [Clostridia bacterium]
MQGNVLLFLVALLPMLCAPLSYALGRKSGKAAVAVMVAASAVTLALLAALLSLAVSGASLAFVWEGFCGLGLRLRADGFRALYACVAGFMWLITSVFSRDYFAHEHNVGRYALFTLFTFGATVGLFLSDTLYSAFLFFEVVSLASYPWVAQEETPEAMRAAQTYLFIAIIGGLVMLMGLFLLPSGLATAGFGELSTLAADVGVERLWLPALLILFGFGAKAGAFPLHIWLPKAHPVAPAPASALLSGILTKAGVFGMLVLSCMLMRGSADWGDLIFRLGVITMFLGALLAIFSVNLKRTLACSSLSQIGFIMVGIGLCGLLGDENGLAAFGTVGHMVNHSLFKLVLFLCAGVVALNTHLLELNDVRGFGRRKPALHIAFLLGALGISGIPLFSGYLSKSLLHEGIVECIAHVTQLGGNARPYAIAEWIFLISGGMTLCYMLKLYLCLFWQRHPTRQAEFDAMTHYLSPLSKFALLFSAALIPAIGLLPNVLETGIGKLSAAFLGAELPPLPIAYFSAENLLGAAKSIAIGLVLFVLMRLWLMKPDASGMRGYVNRWPQWLDLENLVYRPLLALLVSIGYAIAYVADKLMDWLTALLKGIGLCLARLLDGMLDGLGLAARKSLFSHTHPAAPIPVGGRFTYAAGRVCDGFVTLTNRTLRRADPIKTSFVSAFAAGQKELSTQFRRLTRSISFGLLMFCIGLYITLAYLLL